MAKSLIHTVLEHIQAYDAITIEASIISYICQKTGLTFSYDDGLEIYAGQTDHDLISFFTSIDLPLDPETLIDLFEAMVDKDHAKKNGIVFTPAFAADYMYELACRPSSYDDLHIDRTFLRILDPSCGCGMFLASAARHLHETLSYQDIFENHLYGIDLDPDNARRCRLMLHLLPLFSGEDSCGFHTHILCRDSLKCDWAHEFGIPGFDLVIGNPPYVNPHDMDQETALFLKTHFTTTISGTFNLYYAFIEQAFKYITKSGMISFILPNNLFTIRSAKRLRKFIADKKGLYLALDLGGNMIFKPVRTYSCILELTRRENDTFFYASLPYKESLKDLFACIKFKSLSENSLKEDGWHLTDPDTLKNIKKIENAGISLRAFIHTGIATLRDHIYIVDKDAYGYYKISGGIRYVIDPALVRPLYKIPDLKKAGGLSSIKRFIIFPYTDDLTIIPEDILKTKYTATYAYLLSQKNELDKRDGGKENPVCWYAYGRTQGLGQKGRKLLFPTFSDMPSFTLVDDATALFCNGYGILDDGTIDLDTLKRVLDSSIMQYYIKNTSYAIEGGYFCYQKKYVEHFSIPVFTQDEKEMIRTMSDAELDEFLIKKYNLKGDII